MLKIMQSCEVKYYQITYYWTSETSNEMAKFLKVKTRGKNINTGLTVQTQTESNHLVPPEICRIFYPPLYKVLKFD